MAANKVLGHVAVLLTLGLLTTALPAPARAAVAARAATPAATTAPPLTCTLPTNPGMSGTSDTGIVDTGPSDNVIPQSVIPDFGIERGVLSTDQPGSCAGANNKDIPCTCPPNKTDFAAMLGTFVTRGKAGESALSFSTNYADQAIDTNLARITAMIVTLQNFNFDAEGRPGMGCPMVAAPNFGVLQKKLLAGQNVDIRPKS